MHFYFFKLSKAACLFIELEMFAFSLTTQNFSYKFLMWAGYSELTWLVESAD